MKHLRASSLGVPLLLVLLSLLQRPGQTTFDTKFDLTADPAAFLGRSMSLWNPQASFGELQNQAYGYLFPQGPFFLLGELAQVPDWVVQRLWSGLLLVAAYEGARRLFRALSPARPVAAVVAGLAYALAPRLLGLDGVLTGEVLPTAVLPWVVLPLVLALDGRLGSRSAGLLSGAAVLCMGGVNAVENLAALPVALFVVLAGVRRPGGRRLLAWWSAAVAAASLWWILPLLVFGGYSPPFLDYIETAEATTRLLGWTNVTRGADHWVGFVTVGGTPWWPAAHALFTTWWGIAVTAATAGAGLAGLLRRDMHLRAPFVASALLGLLCLSLGHDGTWGSPLAETTRALLDGPLSALRNVHKVDPLVRLPLALGLGHLLTVLLAARGPHAEAAARRRATPYLVGGVVAALLVGSALPLLANGMRKPGWEEIPRAWRQAAAYVDREAGDGRVLVLPGSGFAEQFWGSTIDEPLQGLADAPWVSRSQVPLAPGPTIRLLDAVEERVASGLGSPALAPLLARAGVTMVLVRRDLRPEASDAPSPDRVDLALRRTPGLRSVASFGRSLFGAPPMLEVFEVEAGGPRDPRVEAVELEDVVRMAGDSGDVLTALESGALDARRPVIFERAGGAGTGLALQGDAYRRVERQFGRVHDASSAVMSEDDPLRVRRPTIDYPGPTGQVRVVRHHDSVRSMTASSSAGFADTPGASVPERGPYAAVDGALSTFWQSAPLRRPTGQWLELRLREPTPVTDVEVVAGVGVAGVSVREVEVRAGDQRVRTEANPVTGRATVTLDGSEVRSLRVTVTRTLGDPEEGVVAIREVDFDGRVPSETFVMPDAGADDATTLLMRASPSRTTCLEEDRDTLCRPLEARPGEAEARLSRQVTLAAGGRWEIRGTVVARPTAATRRLFEPLGDAVRVRTGSVLGNDPLVGPQRAYDGDPRTAWVASPGDQAPRLRLRWQEPRVLSRIEVVPGPDGVAPATVLLETPDETRRVDLRGSLGFFEPVRTDRLSLTFERTAVDGRVDGRSVSVAELGIQGLDDLRYRMPGEARTGGRCGFGPPVVVDDRTYDTRVVGTLEDALTGAPLQVQGCSGPVTIGPGEHRIDTVATRQFLPVTTVLAPAGPGGAAREPVTGRTVRVETWDAGRRVVDVSSGDEAVLRIAENANPGWSATLDGKQLEAVAVDGWQQGYVVPAGQGGAVVVTFAPSAWYRAALVVGGLGALAVVLGAALGLAVERRRGVVPLGVAPVAPGAAPRPGWGRAGLLAAGAATWLLGGVAVLAGAAVGSLLRLRGGRSSTDADERTHRRLAAAAGLLVAAAGVVGSAGVLVDADLWPVADLLAGVGVGVAVACVLPSLPARARSVAR